MRLVLILAFLVSMSALACPELQGEYATCRSQAGNMMERKDLVIQQETTPDATIYTLEEISPGTDEYFVSSVEANGKVESQIDPINNVVMRTITYCKNEKLIMDVKYFYLGKKVGSMITKSSKVGDRVIIDAKGVVQGKEYQDSIICE